MKRENIRRFGIAFVIRGVVIGLLTAAVAAAAQAPPLEADDPLAAPTELTGTGTAPNAIDLKWKDNAVGEDGYLIEARYGDGEYALWYRAGALDHFRFEGVPIGVPFTFRVAAWLGEEHSEYSNEAEVTIPGTPVAPATNLTATGAKKKIKLTWTDNATDETGYLVFRLATDGSWITLARLKPNTTTYTNKRLGKSQTWTYKVRAFRGDEYALSSNLATATTLGRR